MKKLILLFISLALIVVACQDESQEISPNQEIAEIDMSDFYLYTDDDLAEKSSDGKSLDKCHTMKVLNRQLKENPSLYNKMYNIEKHTRQLIAAKKPDGKPSGGGGGKPSGENPEPTPYTKTITIPVVINILESSYLDVTDDQIDTQIRILNEDFTNGNLNTRSVPYEFKNLVADVNITFELNTSVGDNGVIREISSKTSWGTNDAMKYSSQDGIDATNPDKNLNIWVCEIGGGILGYAQFPGGTSATDGVVIGSDFFGENTAGGQYGHGRTATHEVGHWLNLRHIWGDGRCKRDDFVSDTPSSDRPNYSCPTYPTAHCRSNDMTMNYMDYVDDNCMYMFSFGQNDRMRALFSSEGVRKSFVQ